ncbi:hypothetical protein Tco_0357548 [Tanacetum coccineum]
MSAHVWSTSRLIEESKHMQGDKMTLQDRTLRIAAELDVRNYLSVALSELADKMRHRSSLISAHEAYRH